MKYTVFTDELDQELHFAFSKSGGPGGQHVNKVNTKVELRFSISKSAILDDEQKAILIDQLSNQMNKEGELILIAQQTRSQLKNKEEVVKKFYELINRALLPVKKRKPTKVSEAAKEKRIKRKKEQSERKERRKLNLDF